MKLSEYKKMIDSLIENNPKSAEFTVVYSIDEEGNAFFPSIYSPSCGYYDKKTNEFDPYSRKKPNAVCIN